jgi:hypothetical protein
LNYIAGNGLTLLVHFLWGKNVYIQPKDEHRDKKKFCFFFFGVSHANVMEVITHLRGYICVSLPCLHTCCVLTILFFLIFAPMSFSASVECFSLALFVSLYQMSIFLLTRPT